MIRVGIIGTGFGSKIHLPGFRRLADVEVAGLAGADVTKTQSIADAAGTRAFATWQDLVNDPTIDAVSIATPPSLHAEIAQAALRLGKSVLCEKPLAMNVAEAQAMTDAARAAGVTHMIDCELRAIPHFVILKSLLETKRIGAIRTIHIRWMTGGRARPGVAHGWQNEVKFGGGALLNLVSHVIDYTEWLFGPIASVFARLETRKPVSEGGRVADADDACDLLLTLKDGTPISVAVSNVAIAGRGHLIDVYGEQGTLRLENPNLKDTVYGFRLTRYGKDETDTEEIPAPGFPMVAEPSADGRLDAFTILAKRFIQGIRNGTSPAPSFFDGLRVQRVLDSARASNTAGTWVAVQE